MRIEHGDCREVIKTLADASVDSCVCDPPYALINNSGTRSPLPGQYTPIGRPKEPRGGFMGKKWDTGETAFDPAFWSEVLRVLKPGAHLIAFSGTRTYHRMACAIEDAGFEIRDQIGWLYGSGFPKSHNVAVAIDKQNGIGPRSKAFNMKGRGDRAQELDENGREFLPPYEATTDAARAWQGWGTALKPAWEPICLARKPLSGTVAQTVLEHGTGAINIDGCRIEGEPWQAHTATGLAKVKFFSQGEAPAIEKRPHDLGRWPANVLHDGSEEVLEAFAAYGERSSGTFNGNRKADKFRNAYGDFKGAQGERAYEGNSGSAARFFYSAKADADDRLGSKHPTVKPVDLMAYLCRLVTPPGGLVLDPFAGSGTTGMACLREGFNCILIEREAEYIADINRRLAHVRGADTPLFGGSAA
jgi:DNA modification methylase